MGRLFFELIQIALGHRTDFTSAPAPEQWAVLYRLAAKQALLGVLYPAVERMLALHPLPAQEPNERGCRRKPQWLVDWVGARMAVEHENVRLDDRCCELTNLFEHEGWRTCVLKGQAVARLYDDPLLRQPGDIDLWVDGTRADILRFVCRRWPVGETVYHHADVTIFSDTETEIHFHPSWLYNPFVNRRMQRFFRQQAALHFADGVGPEGFRTPRPVLNMVFSLAHIFHHFLDEGVGLRQLMDYYYILLRSTHEERAEALRVLHSLHLAGFAAAVELILERTMLLPEEHRLCMPDEQRGHQLIAEVLRGGNFGQHDVRRLAAQGENRLQRTWRKLRRQLHFLMAYPWEVPWIPLWKLWHYTWRWSHGYFETAPSE